MRVSWLGLCALCFVSVPTITGNAYGAETPAVTRVEEDWIAYVEQPDEDISAPQITNIISPTLSADEVFGLVQLNHRSEPSFRAGGIQLQSWVGESKHDQVDADVSGTLRFRKDKLQYTVVMETDVARLRFSVKSGRSKSWGQFPREELALFAPMQNPSLAEYDPQVSVDNTSINVGAHRVVLMAQYQVRYYSGNQLVKTDNTVRYLHRYKDLVEFVSLEEYEKNEEYFNIEITE